MKNPFLVPDVNLFSLSNDSVSIAGKDEIYCEQVEQIGQNIQKSLNEVAITNASIKCKDFSKKVNKTKRSASGIDSKVMFNRMIAVGEREKDLNQFFEFVNLSEPMLMFKHGLIKKPDKSYFG